MSERPTCGQCKLGDSESRGLGDVGLFGQFLPSAPARTAQHRASSPRRCSIRTRRLLGCRLPRATGCTGRRRPFLVVLE